MKLLTPLEYDADFIIAGGGPAGAACAWHLAKAGAKVMILDSQKFPRDKVCGDFVGPVAINELMKMGFENNREFNDCNPITQAALYLDGAEKIIKKIPEVDGLPGYGRVIPRMLLDNWILQAAIKAGVTVKEECRVIDFENYSNGVKVNIKGKTKSSFVFGKILVGADGSSSVIARILNGGKPDPRDRILAVRAYYENIRCTAEQAELYFTEKSFPGYYWFFPTGKTTANVGVGMVLENFPKEETNLKKLLLDLVASDESLKRKIGDGILVDKVVGWPLSTYNPGNPKIAERVLLIGDAAGLINSLNGEGIQYALLSGRWAAETLKTCFQQNNFGIEMLKQYEKKIIAELDYEMVLSNFIIQCIRNRNLNDVWLKMLDILVSRARHDNQFADVAGGILAGLMPANKALNLSFLSKAALQGFYTLGGELLYTIKRGPAAVSKMMLQGAGKGLQITASAFRNPGDYASWGMGLGENTLKLSGHVIKSIVPSLKIS